MYSAKAQYVTIPDASFVTYLQAEFPTCMSGNQMDTTCAGIVNETFVDVSNFNIFDLTGIEYFDNLDTLYSTFNQLTSLPNLPNSILYLDCSDNSLTSLPTLPSSLIELNCSNNQLTNLPSLPNNLSYFECSTNSLVNLPTLPNSLKYLFCNYNQLTSLPSLPNNLLSLGCSTNLLVNLPTLPDSLQSLSCGPNQLTSLPSLPNNLLTLSCSVNSLVNLPTLPNSLQSLDCDNNQLTSLPSLPTSLVVFYCDYNSLTSLPTLPNSLNYLHCDYNQLTSLPSLPTSLLDLTCGYNLLASLPTLPNTLDFLYCSVNNLLNLPTLPNSLGYLDCSSNQLTSLPTLPNYLYDLNASANNIKCFPTFPESLNYGSFDIANNPFSCLPNYLQGMSSDLLLYPLCVTGDLINNPNNCSGAKGIVGYTYKDNNTDCLLGSPDSILANFSVQLYDSTNTLISQFLSIKNGIYNFAKPTGTYTVKIDTTEVPYTVQCTYPGIDSTVILTTSNPLQQNVNFALSCKPGFDVGVQSVLARGIIFPGQQHQLTITAGDLSQWFGLNCAAGISGQVIVSVSGPVSFDSVMTGALTPTIVGNVFTYNISDFGTINNLTAFGLLFTADTTAIAGDTICVNVSVTPTSGDNNVNNNIYNYCYVVQNANDPNFKETYPEIVPVGFDDYFTYTIHFQNTGTAPAMNILLTDSLDSNLDVSTFKVINYSHRNTCTVEGNQLSIRFPNIQLVDSVTNFDASQGFVQYKIKPKQNLFQGTKIYNTASIYFDYNAPVITNTTINEFVIPQGVANIISESNIQIAPNPFTTQTTILFSKEQIKTIVKIMDVLGNVVMTELVTGKTATIDMNGKAKGIYFIKIEDENKNIVNKKIIVQ